MANATIFGNNVGVQASYAGDRSVAGNNSSSTLELQEYLDRNPDSNQYILWEVVSQADEAVEVVRDLVSRRFEILSNLDDNSRQGRLAMAVIPDLSRIQRGAPPVAAVITSESILIPTLACTVFAIHDLYQERKQSFIYCHAEQASRIDAVERYLLGDERYFNYSPHLISAVDYIALAIGDTHIEISGFGNEIFRSPVVVSND